MQDVFQLHENILEAWAADNSSLAPIKCFSSEPATAFCPSPTPGALGNSGEKQIDLQFKFKVGFLIVGFICDRQIVYYASLYIFKIVIF